MKKKIFINRKAVKGPWGGENSFMGALCKFLEKNYELTTNIDSNFNLALINALTLINYEDIKKIYKRGIPIIHRKTNFIASGSEKMRSKKNGIVFGDKKQIDFDKFVSHSIFQSKFSKKTFESEGFKGNYSIIKNGADEEKFNIFLKRFFKLKKRRFWQKNDTFKILIVSWSPNLNKGFESYKEIDENFKNTNNIQIKFIGNTPKNFKLKNILYSKPLPHKKLAKEYKSSHALLYLSKHETCSNTIIEAINCGLPVIYLNSGSNKEIVGNCGIRYTGKLYENLEVVQKNYNLLVKNCLERDLKISKVGPLYDKIIKKYIK